MRIRATLEFALHHDKLKEELTLLYYLLCCLYAQRHFELTIYHYMWAHKRGISNWMTTFSLYFRRSQVPFHVVIELVFCVVEKTLFCTFHWSRYFCTLSSKVLVSVRKLGPWALPTPSPRNASTHEMCCSCVGYDGTSSAHYLPFSLNLNFSLSWIQIPLRLEPLFRSQNGKKEGALVYIYIFVEGFIPYVLTTRTQKQSIQDPARPINASKKRRISPEFHFWYMFCHTLCVVLTLRFV